MRHFTLADERDSAEVVIVVVAIGVFLWFGRRVLAGFDVLFGVSLLATSCTWAWSTPGCHKV